MHEGKGLWNQMGASEISHKLLRLLVGKQGMEHTSFHIEAPGSVLCLPVLTLSWHHDLYSRIRVRPRDGQGRREPTE